MDMFDEARAMKATMELCRISQRELARRLGRAQSYVANKLRLLYFSEEERALILSLGLTERHARAILPLEGGCRSEVIREVGRRGMTVRECEAYVSSRRMPRLFSYRSGERAVDLIRRAEGALKTIAEVLTEGGVTAGLRVSGSGSVTYMTLRIEEP